MEAAESSQLTVKVELYLPREVRDWVDRRAAAVYKGRSAYLRDMVIERYQKEAQPA